MVFQTYLLSSKSCIAGWEQEDELSLFLLLIILGLWSKHFWNIKPRNSTLRILDENMPYLKILTDTSFSLQSKGSQVITENLFQKLQNSHARTKAFLSTQFNYLLPFLLCYKK